MADQLTTNPAAHQYRYFVAFAVPGGHGRNEVALALPIRSLADIEVIEAMLRERNGCPVAVTGWQRFEED